MSKLFIFSTNPSKIILQNKVTLAPVFNICNDLVINYHQFRLSSTAKGSWMKRQLMDTVLVILQSLLSGFKIWRTDMQSLSSLLLKEGLSEIMILTAFFKFSL